MWEKLVDGNLLLGEEIQETNLIDTWLDNEVNNPSKPIVYERLFETGIERLLEQLPSDDHRPIRICLFPYGDHTKEKLSWILEHPQLELVSISDNSITQDYEADGLIFWAPEDLVDRQKSIDFLVLSHQFYENDMASRLVQQGLEAEKIHRTYTHEDVSLHLRSVMEGQEELKDVENVICLFVSNVGLIPLQKFAELYDVEKTIILTNDRSKNVKYEELGFKSVKALDSYRGVYQLLDVLSPKRVHFLANVCDSAYAYMVRKRWSDAYFTYEFIDSWLIPHTLETNETYGDIIYSYSPERVAALEQAEYYVLDNCDQAISKLSPGFDLLSSMREENRYGMIYTGVWREKSRPELRKNQKPKRIVYATNMPDEDMFRKVPSLRMGWTQWEMLSEFLEKTDVEFRMYNGSDRGTAADQKRYSFFRDRVKNSNFVYHSFMRMDLLKEEIQNADLGWFFTTYDKDVSRSAQNVAQSTMCTYIDLGIPVVVPENLSYASSLVKKFNAGCVISDYSVSNISRQINKLDMEAVRDGAWALREFMLDQNNQELIRLEEDLYSQ